LIGFSADGGVEHNHRVRIRRIGKNIGLAIEREAGRRHLGLDHSRVDAMQLVRSFNCWLPRERYVIHDHDDSTRLEHVEPLLVHHCHVGMHPA